MKLLKAYAPRLNSLLASPIFFWGIIGFFVLEALWFVFFMAYPMAFDEDFHLGVIRVYAEQWSPFLGTQPEGADAFGALARDPSYLFHYLMSFPYRLLTFLNHNEAAIVIVLRLINIALFVGGLLLFRQVLTKLKVSAALSNTIFAVFVLVPIVPWLAATINYDNLLFLLLPWIFLLAFKLNESFAKKEFDAKTFVTFVIACMLLSLVKYAALPILLGVVVYLVYTLLRAFKNKPRNLWRAIQRSAKTLSIGTATVLLGTFLLVFGMFFEKYGINLLVHQEPAPSCEATLSVERCMEYSPWARNYNLAQNRDEFEANPVTYMGEWLYGMWHRSFFAVSGPEQNYETRLGPPIPSFTTVVLAVLGMVAIGVTFGRLFTDRPFLQLVCVAGVVYIITLWIKLYGSYIKTGEPVAINGRYLMPLLPVFGAVIGLSFSILLQKYRFLKPYLAIGTILLFLCGGGVFTFMLLAKPAWYW